MLSSKDARSSYHRAMASSSMLSFKEQAKQFFIFEQFEKDVFRDVNPQPMKVHLLRVDRAACGGDTYHATRLIRRDCDIEHFVVDTSMPVDYRVRRIRNGRSFCTRTVETVQDGRIVFTLEASFHVLEEDAVVHQDVIPAVPSWRNLMSIDELRPWLQKEIAEGRIKVQPVVEKRFKYYESQANQNPGDLFEVRPTCVDRHIGIGIPDTSRTFYAWFKARGELGNCEKLHRYLVAYSTDAIMGGSAFRPHFVNDFSPSMLYSLDHNLWLHQHEVRADQWMLMEANSTVAGRGRAFTTGRMWSEDGRLLLSCTQEVVLRGRGNVSKL